MNTSQRQAIIDTSWDIHSQVESAYFEHPAGKGDDAWHDKQRLLLADMALHLLQTAIKPGDLPLDKLQNNLHAILTISDQFLPQAGLKHATDTLYTSGDGDHKS
ncbi:MAG: hypothetical protein SWN10_22835 [Pseudomonadota bacterium]|uniref:Uncharacterized protein n=1 Tax=Alteromonas alba TaxID=2079529 RepID=A0A2S9V755_9ALTE|nr:hypothetical protein [Alteromonas alba]MDY6929912.1 hypothetical protein [Pseudomonadota bacterium]PRO72185.1 hypothetical protein C6Y40_18590 [Alteromonas alba]|tara:strand:- start:3020 stop:3331 length:312 start_codon:yes stop_codon:yes gene_type:complete